MNRMAGGGSRRFRLKWALAMMISIGAGSLLSLSSLNCTQHGDSDEGRPLAVATDATFRPFTFVDESGQIAGHDIELFREVAKRMGRSVEFSRQPWDGLIPGLSSRKYDVIASALTITTERAQQVAFSEPYYDASQVIMVREKEDRIQSSGDLEGKVIGVEIGSSAQQVAEHIASADVKKYPSVDLAAEDLRNGSIDALINDEGQCHALFAAKPGLRIIGTPLTSEHYGFAVRKEGLRVIVWVICGHFRVLAACT